MKKVTVKAQLSRSSHARRLADLVDHVKTIWIKAAIELYEPPTLAEGSLKKLAKSLDRCSAYVDAKHDYAHSQVGTCGSSMQLP